jgi:hypothetical protein
VLIVNINPNKVIYLYFRVELDEMKSRPFLLGACTSCPVLHEKLDVSLVYARSLEAQLKLLFPHHVLLAK